MQTEWILTFTGKKFYPMKPKFEDISIVDIAHASSNLTRFGGHCRVFYTLAQHCVLVAQRVWNLTQDRKLALAALLHDASEAYLMDIPRPLKYLPEFDQYRNAEKVLQEFIYSFFGINLSEAEIAIIKDADNYILNIEAWNLMLHHPDWLPKLYQPEIKSLDVWSSKIAKRKFIEAIIFYGEIKEDEF